MDKLQATLTACILIKIDSQSETVCRVDDYRIQHASIIIICG